MLGYRLHDDVAGIDRPNAAGSDSRVVLNRSPDRIVRTVVTDVRILECAQPNARSVRYGLAFLESDPFFASEELLVSALRLDRLENHRPQNRPLAQQLHPASVDFDGLIQNHWPQATASLLLDDAHPGVVAFSADSGDSLLRVLTIEDRAVRLLHVDGRKFN